VQRFWLVSGGFVSKTIQIGRETIQIGRIRSVLSILQVLGYFLKSGYGDAVFPHGHLSAVNVGSLILLDQATQRSDLSF
ncbi:MAG TPA: hypothetical protein VE242_07215, partial [Chthoniobacterales bacterium]|nr:hypothetical protein [Chthoniobacterales bacterium]